MLSFLFAIYALNAFCSFYINT